MEEELKLIEIRHQQEIDSINLMHEQRILSLDEKHKLDLIDCRNEYDRDVEILREKYCIKCCIYGGLKNIIHRQYINVFLMKRIGGFFFDIMVVAGIAAIRLDILEKRWVRCNRTRACSTYGICVEL